MLQDSVVHVAMYDQQVYGQLRAPEEPLQSCKHHSWNSAGQSLRICQPKETKLRPAY